LSVTQGEEKIMDYLIDDIDGETQVFTTRIFCECGKLHYVTTINGSGKAVCDCGYTPAGQLIQRKIEISIISIDTTINPTCELAHELDDTGLSD
jgi:hypothetical protein